MRQIWWKPISLRKTNIFLKTKRIMSFELDEKGLKSWILNFPIVWKSKSFVIFFYVNLLIIYLLNF
jgi:hypothetical protein